MPRNMLRSLGLVLALLLLAPLMPASSQKPALDGVQFGYNPGSPLFSARFAIWSDDVDNLNPTVAYNSRHNEYLVVWWNDRGATRDIYAQRVTADGVLKSQWCVINQAGFWNWLPAVAYSPARDEYLVVYTYKANDTDYDLWARRMAWNGAWLSPEFAISTYSGRQWYPSVAYNADDDQYLVVYENYWSDTFRDIAAQRVRASDGALLSWRNLATAAGQVRRLPDAAWLASTNEYLVAFSWLHPAGDNNIHAVMTNADMSYLSPEVELIGHDYDLIDAAVTTSPGEYLVVWEDGPGNPERTVYGRRISGLGVMSDPFAILAQTGQVYLEPDTAYSAVYGYVTVARFKYSDTDTDIYLRYSKPGQNSIAPGYWAIDSLTAYQRAPAIACDRFGSCLVVYEDNYDAASFNITGRLLLAHKAVIPLAAR